MSSCRTFETSKRTLEFCSDLRLLFNNRRSPFNSREGSNLRKLTTREPIAHAACKVVRALEIFGSRSLDTFMPPTTSDDDIAEHLPHSVGEPWEPAVRRSLPSLLVLWPSHLYNVSTWPRVTSTSLYIRSLHYCILIDTSRAPAERERSR